jgi:hypothetical protein
MALELDEKKSVENEDGEGVTIEDLAAYMRVSTRTVERDLQRGKYEKLKAKSPTGAVLLKPPPGYDPSIVAAAKDQAENVSLQTLVVTLGNMVNDGRRHQERLLDLIAGPIEKASQRMADRETMLFGRIESLQDKVIEQSAVVERLLSEEHNRILATVEAEARGRRLDQGLEMVKGALPQVLDAIGAAKGINVRKLKAAENVLSHLPVEALDAILSAKGEDALIPPEAQEDAAILLDELRKDAAAKQAKQTQPSATGVADPVAEGAKTEGE